MKDEDYACPKCGSRECVRDDVDIGVGIQHSPWQCTKCGYEQGDELRREFPELFKSERIAGD